MIEINSPRVKKEKLLSEIEREVQKLNSLKEIIQSEVSGITYVNLSELLSYSGGEFIRKAYLSILGREPDPEGFKYYLENLLKGKFSKIDVIVRLRYSREGRERGIKIKGLSKHRILYSFLSTLPGFGGIVSGIKFFVTLPRFIAYVRGIEATLDFQISNLKSLISDLGKIQAEHNFRISNLEVNLLKLKDSQEESVKQIERLSTIVDKQLDKVRRLESGLERVSLEIREVGLGIERVKKDISDVKIELQGEPVPDTVEVELKGPVIEEKNYYTAFESLFRGSYEDVKRHLERYLKYIPERLVGEFPVLDVGCGRGEFLELLKDHGIEAIGVDIDIYQVENLEKKGYSVYRKDVNSFLKESNTKFSALTAFQVIEHFDIDYLKDFLKLSFERLVPGGVLILETVNPWNFEAFPRFYIDETHVRPVPPDTLSFMLRWFGFSDLKLLFLSPLTEKRSKGEELKKFYGDYALISKKPVKL